MVFIYYYRLYYIILKPIIIIDGIYVSLVDHPETPSNVSIIAKANNLFVSWCPGFNGGVKQNFFIEYKTESLSNWTFVGPVTGNMKNKINFTLHFVTPDTFYLVRVFSRNIYGDSNKSDIVKFQIFGKRD